MLVEVTVKVTSTYKAKVETVEDDDADKMYDEATDTIMEDFATSGDEAPDDWELVDGSAEVIDVDPADEEESD